MTRTEARSELFDMPPRDPGRAVDFYRRVLRAGVGWRGIEDALASLQDTPNQMIEALMQVWREEGSPTPPT